MYLCVACCALITSSIWIPFAARWQCRWFGCNIMIQALPDMIWMSRLQRQWIRFKLFPAALHLSMRNPLNTLWHSFRWGSAQSSECSSGGYLDALSQGEKAEKDSSLVKIRQEYFLRCCGTLESSIIYMCFESQREPWSGLCSRPETLLRLASGR